MAALALAKIHGSLATADSVCSSSAPPLAFPRLLQQWSAVLQGKCMQKSFLIVARSLSVGTQWAKPFQGGGLAGVEILLMFSRLLVFYMERSDEIVRCM